MRSWGSEDIVPVLCQSFGFLLSKENLFVFARVGGGQLGKLVLRDFYPAKTMAKP